MKYLSLLVLVLLFTHVSIAGAQDSEHNESVGVIFSWSLTNYSDIPSVRIGYEDSNGNNISVPVTSTDKLASNMSCIPDENDPGKCSRFFLKVMGIFLVGSVLINEVAD